MLRLLLLGRWLRVLLLLHERVMDLLRYRQWWWLCFMRREWMMIEW